MSDLDTYIQDALDLIEFANGDTNTTWGAKRAALGHPAPFNLKMMGIGNENWDAPYIERYAKFHAVLKEKHPEIQLVSSAGPSPNDVHFKYAWPKLRELHADIVDEHCYDKPAWFLGNTHRYDNYDRNGPKVFFGEYAAQSDYTVSVKNRNNLECALAEAAYMTGLERNAAVVRMASYAPLFANTEAWQWTPNMIWVDSLRLYATPNYYVQQLFSKNRGDVVLPTQIDGATTNATGAESLYANAVRDEAAGEIILKVVNPGVSVTEAKINLAGVITVAAQAKATVLAGEKLSAENSMAAPQKISPVESAVNNAAKEFTYSFAPRSVTVLRLKAR